MKCRNAKAISIGLHIDNQGQPENGPDYVLFVQQMLGVLQTFRDRWQGEEATFEYVEACIRLTKPHNI